MKNQQVQPNTTSRTFTENAAVWLGPLFYAYSNGLLGTVVTEATSSSTTSYRVIGGLVLASSAYFAAQLISAIRGRKPARQPEVSKETVRPKATSMAPHFSTIQLPRGHFTGTVDRNK
jgi:hypothetical protein